MIDKKYGKKNPEIFRFFTEAEKETGIHLGNTIEISVLFRGHGCWKLEIRSTEAANMGFLKTVAVYYVTTGEN
jgi:hypothetical protein